jgi:hypothetical protein
MNKTNEKTTLKVEKFSLNSQKSRSERWREWYSKSRIAFGAALPMLANQIGQQCDPEAYWRWGLEWSPALFDFDNMSVKEEQHCWLDFQKSQYSLMDVLSANFATHEKQIIADHDPLVLTEKVTRQFSEIFNGLAVKTIAISPVSQNFGNPSSLWESKFPFFPFRAVWV